MTIEVPLTRGKVALIDDSDYELVSRYKWHASPSHGVWYARRKIQSPETTQKMHQLLTGWPRTDHINGDGLDNRRANLRRATNAENMQNQRKMRGSSRFKGVSWSKKCRCWEAQIRVNRLRLHLGSFAEETAAALAYDAAARINFGEFAALNFPEPGERSALS